MARLTNVYRSDEISYVKIARRQLPIIAGHDLMMLMDLNSKGLAIDNPPARAKELEEFTRKYDILSPDELKTSLEVKSADLIPIISQTVQCVGCRRSVERLFYQLMLSGHHTLDPLVIKSNGILTISEEKIKSQRFVCTLLRRHNSTLSALLDNQMKNKKNSRCALHSLDSFRSRPFSETWREVWASMKQSCREELSVIETKELLEILDNYLRKHKFCQDCRTKNVKRLITYNNERVSLIEYLLYLYDIRSPVEKAYTLLIDDTNSAKEKGFVSALYSNIKQCLEHKHIHLLTKADFIESLIKRAEPEIIGSNLMRQRERHAKTLEIAQEEVLTCVGMCIYERLRRIFISLREEERACQVLAAVGVHALSRSFDMAVEQKQGISKLELLCQEMSRVEKAKEHKKEQKKLKKKKKKSVKKNKESESTSESKCEDEAEHDLSCLLNFPCKSNSMTTCSKSIDGGYASENSQINSRTGSLLNSPEGSEVSCSDGLCNHEQHPGIEMTLTSDTYNLKPFEKPRECRLYMKKQNISLQQMLEGLDIDEEEETDCYIPDEVVLEFKNREKNIKQLREKLRENLRQNFDKMCKSYVRNCND